MPLADITLPSGNLVEWFNNLDWYYILGMVIVFFGAGYLVHKIWTALPKGVLIVIAIAVLLGLGVLAVKK